MSDPSVLALVDTVHHRLLAEWGDEHAGDTSQVAAGEDRVRALVHHEAPLLPSDRLAAVVRAVQARVTGLGPLEPLLADPAVTEVMVNGAGPVWVERAGEVTATTTELDEPTVSRLIERIVAPLGLRVDRSSPMVDARLPDGSRVNAVVRPLAIDGPCLTIRRFGSKPVPLPAFADGPVAELLGQVVHERRNVVVSGGTGAGKTTLLNALAGEIPLTERVVTIEDSAELRLPGDHVVRLEARPASADGLGAVSIRDLVRNALRMRPDRIVVGEVRGAEALDMLAAMNTGHDGALSTCHANSPEDALRRLETLSLLAGVDVPLDAIREQLVAAVDLVVQVARCHDGARRVVSVGEPVEGGQRTRLRCRPVVDDRGRVAAPERPPRGGSAHPDEAAIP
ncbi:MAG: CpaF family protein [Acidimicrobiales bacterium]